MSTGGEAFANTEQAEFWDGHEGDHWVRHQERYDQLTGAFHMISLEGIPGSKSAQGTLLAVQIKKAAAVRIG